MEQQEGDLDYDEEEEEEDDPMLDSQNASEDIAVVAKEFQAA